jgi:hypothetical protein
MRYVAAGLCGGIGVGLWTGWVFQLGAERDAMDLVASALFFIASALFSKEKA